jgi:hypothetical protein
MTVKSAFAGFGYKEMTKTVPMVNVADVGEANLSVVKVLEGV